MDQTARYWKSYLKNSQNLGTINHELSYAKGTSQKISDNVLNNKPKLNNDSMVKSNNGDQKIISNTKNNEKIINNNNNLKYKDSNITPQNNKKRIVVDNIIPKKQMTSVQNKSKTELIVVGKTLNSIIKESILTDAAFT